MRDLRSFLDDACARRGDAPLLLFRGESWSYAEVGRRSDALAGGLWQLGLRPGDRVAAILPTTPEHVLLRFAQAKLGLVACPLHTDLAPIEQRAALAQLEPAALVARPETLAALRESGALPASLHHRIVAGGSSPQPGKLSLTELETGGSLAAHPAPAADAIAEILTTSGSTGKPKGAMLSHRMAVLTGEGFAHWLGLGPDDRLFTCLPYSHVNARFYSTLGAVAAGASLALEERFSASRFWRWIGDSGATEANAIGAMLHILLQRPPSAEDRAHRLRLVYSAPAMGAAAHAAFEARFGVRLVIGYGLTESTFGFIHPVDEPRDLDSMGLPRRHPDPSIPADVRLVDDGRDVADSEVGEVWLRNPATFSGYFRDEARTAAAITEDGWLRTGDLARRGDGGCFHFVARAKQMIRRRGENLAPREVEEVLERHPGVHRAAVIGVPSPLGDDEVRAYVELRKGAAVSTEELAAHCREHLAAFKVPSQWRFVDRLPLTPTQRIAYHQLPSE